MKKAGRILSRIGIGVVIVAILAGASGTYYLNNYIPNTAAPKSFPLIDGEIQLPGLDGPVDVYRDNMGTPHIYATTLHDLFMAQGYVHAQDRFWQMDFWRHVGSGQLSEMMGESTLETDKFLRTLGWRQIADQEYAMLRPESKAILDDYAKGVNAYIQGREPIELSLEYLVLTGVLNPDYEIKPWTPVQSLTWGKGMAWDLGGKMKNEIERAILLKTLTPEQVDELFPPYSQDHPVIVPIIGEDSASANHPVEPATYFDLPAESLAALQNNMDALESLLGPRNDSIGSNSWAVSGKLTTTGLPLFANDMHLAKRIPSIWYQNALHCRPKTDACPLEVTGFSFVTVPGVVAGHNDQIAWGFTNVGPDVTDLYIEKVNPENPNQYEVNGEWVDFDTRTETIQVGGSEVVEITVRITRHGPVVSDTFGSLKDDVDPDDPEAIPFKEKAGVALPQNYVISLAWTALQPSTPFEAIWGFNNAQNWEEFREAARGFHVPAQNILYADTSGNIGYQMPGDIPIRAKGDGRYPVPGWTNEYDWTGFIPFDELPYAYNPDSGYIVTANNQTHPWDYPYFVTADWNYGFRAERIVDMIENSPKKIDVEYFQSMHGDSKNLNAETLVPILLALELDPEPASVRDHFLGSWDYHNRADSQSAAVFEWFWSNLLTRTFNDDLPEAYWPGGGSRWYEVMRNLVTQPDSSWWDDKNSQDDVETRDEIFVLAFEETLDQMQKEYGANTDKWPTWGELHTIVFQNETLGESGIGPIEALFNRGPFETGGGSEIVNATGWTVGESFEVNWIPSERMIVDLSNLDNSLTIHSTGQSGHAYHTHYIDMAPLWVSVEYYPMWWEQNSVIDDAEGHLRLVP